MENNSKLTIAHSNIDRNEHLNGLDEYEIFFIRSMAKAYIGHVFKLKRGK